MYLKRIADEVSALLNDTTLGSTGTNYSRTKNWIRDCYLFDIISRCNDWWFLRSEGYIQTQEEINDGTVTVTNGSKTVTGSSTAFTSSVNGRMFVCNGKAMRIAASGYSSATSLTLEYEWQGDSASGASYTIVKDKYALPRWLDPKRIFSIKPVDSRNLVGKSQDEIDGLYPSKSSVGDPKYFSFVNRERTTHETGTIEVTLGSKTVTGTSTSWDSTIEQYDKLSVGANTYTVDSVNSSTSISIFENPKTSASSGSSYSVIKDRFYIELYPYPKELKVYKVSGSTIPPILEDDSDVSYLPDEFYGLLVKGAYIRGLKHNQDPGVTKEIEEFQFMLKRLISLNNRDDYRTESWWK